MLRRSEDSTQGEQRQEEDLREGRRHRARIPQYFYREVRERVQLRTQSFLQLHGHSDEYRGDQAGSSTRCLPIDGIAAKTFSPTRELFIAIILIHYDLPGCTTAICLGRTGAMFLQLNMGVHKGPLCGPLLRPGEKSIAREREA